MKAYWEVLTNVTQLIEAPDQKTLTWVIFGGKQHLTSTLKNSSSGHVQSTCASGFTTYVMQIIMSVGFKKVSQCTTQI